VIGTVYEIDPLKDLRWPEFLKRHKFASVYHSPDWLEALRRTYGYRASALATCGPGGELTNALVFCRVHSWLTGRRAVSMPFSDHCAPLVANQEELGRFVRLLEQDRATGKYLEIRPVSGCPLVASLTPEASYCLHRLDLRPGLGDLFRGCHPNHVRRKVARAEREGLVYEEGRSESLLRKFYRLAVMTRRRQELPPQPLAWFRNLAASFGEKLKIRLLSKDRQPAAAILTIQYKSTMTYKYGVSDTRYHPLGVMQLLLWTTIKEANNNGLLEFDLGRSDWGNQGLIAFKDRWGAARSSLVYLRSPMSKHSGDLGRAVQLAKPLFTVAPDCLLTAVGELFYRHIG
jgi:hypothetical protein